MQLANVSLVAATLLALVHPALAEERIVTESHFIVTTTDSNGEVHSGSSREVPLIVGACYEWQIRLAKTKRPVSITEIFTLPSAPLEWGVASNATLSEDRRTVTTTFEQLPALGWIWNNWCVNEGDPEGPHEIVVLSGEQELARFDFVTKSAQLDSTKAKMR